MRCMVVIPALNEAANIPALADAVDAMVAQSSQHDWTFVLADNGSTDETARRAAQRGMTVVHEPRRGYGAACLKAIAWIEQQDEPPDVIAFLDADLADDPAYLPHVIEPIARDEADIVIGSRVKLAQPGALNLVQRFGNGLACQLIHLLAGKKFTDLGPMRAARWSTFQQLNMQDQTWGWTVELQMKAALLDLRCAEVDVPYRRRRTGRSKISGTVRGVITAGTKIIATIVVLWWRRRDIRGKRFTTKSTERE